MLLCQNRSSLWAGEQEASGWQLSLVLALCVLSKRLLQRGRGRGPAEEGSGGGLLFRHEFDLMGLSKCPDTTMTGTP